jgi:hypothetical protein
VLKNPSVPLQESKAVDLPSLQAKGVRPYTPGVDVWAVGVLAFELVCGRPPFEVEDEAQTAALIMYSDNIKFPSNRSGQWADFVRQVRRGAAQRPCCGCNGQCCGSWLACWRVQATGQPAELPSGRLGGLAPHGTRRRLTPPVHFTSLPPRQALTKSPDHRPNAAQLLQHQWIQINLQRALLEHRRASKETLLQPLPLPHMSLPPAAGAELSDESLAQRSAPPRSLSMGGSGRVPAIPGAAAGMQGSSAALQRLAPAPVVLPAHLAVAHRSPHSTSAPCTPSDRLKEIQAALDNLRTVPLSMPEVQQVRAAGLLGGYWRGAGGLGAAGWGLLAAGCWLLAAGCWLLAAGCWLLAAGCWLLAAGCWLLAAGCCMAWWCGRPGAAAGHAMMAPATDATPTPTHAHAHRPSAPPLAPARAGGPHAHVAAQPAGAQAAGGATARPGRVRRQQQPRRQAWHQGADEVLLPAPGGRHLSRGRRPSEGQRKVRRRAVAAAAAGQEALGTGHRGGRCLAAAGARRQEAGGCCRGWGGRAVGQRWLQHQGRSKCAGLWGSGAPGLPAEASRRGWGQEQEVAC